MGLGQKYQIYQCYLFLDFHHLKGIENYIYIKLCGLTVKMLDAKIKFSIYLTSVYKIQSIPVAKLFV